MRPATRWLRFTKRTLRELRILRHMKHENVIDIASIFIPGDRKSFEDIYVQPLLLSCIIQVVRELYLGGSDAQVKKKQCVTVFSTIR